MPASAHTPLSAALQLSEGDRAGALTTLEKGIKAQWWTACGMWPWIGDDWALKSLHGEPRFEAIKNRCRAEINKQRKLAGLPPAVLK